MNCPAQLQALPLSAIDFKDKSYSLVPWDDPPGEDLTTSIKNHGILHPPIVTLGRNNTFRIVAGRKRLAVARELTPDCPVFCLLIDDDEYTEKDIFAVILEEAETGKGLSIVEQVVFLDKLLQRSGPDTALSQLGKMGFKPQKHVLDDLLQLRFLGKQALRALHQGTVTARNARKLLKLPLVDQDLIIRLITELSLGGSKQQKLIDLCIELILRRDTSLQEILADFPGASEKNQPGNIPQHGAELLSWLYQQCFPRAARAEDDFRRRLARLDLPPDIRISHTEAFEDDAVTLSIRFPDFLSLDKIVKDITRLIREKGHSPGLKKE